MSKIAVQIIFTNTSRFASKVLTSLQAQTEKDFSLYVYDNSCDATEQARVRKALEASGLPFSFTFGETNLGFTAHNILFAQHAAPFVFLMQDDAYLDAGYLEACVKRLEADPQIGSVNGLVFRWTQAPTGDETVVPFSLLDTTGMSYACLGYAADRYAAEPFAAHAAELAKAHPIFGSSGALVMYRRSAVLDVSPEGTLFDPTFFMYKEDVDLAIRLQRKGYAAWFEPEAGAFHARGVRSEGLSWFGRARQERQRPMRLRFMAYHNQWKLYFYHASWRLGWKDWILTCGHEIKRSAALCILASPWQFIRAWSLILRDLPRALKRRGELNKILTAGTTSPSFPLLRKEREVRSDT